MGWALVMVFNLMGPGLFFVQVPTGLVLSAMGVATLTGVLAAVAPARRAARYDPAVAIRYV